MTLPILLSIPHGGTETPPEAAPHSIASKADLFSDGDACTLEIYDLGGEVAQVVRMEIARAFVDLNRAPDNRPPRNPDGVVKSLTADRRPIWRGGGEPGPALTRVLIDGYWRPWHQRLREAAGAAGLRLALDCHSMAERATAIAAQPGQPRPAFCLSNGDGLTAPIALMQRLAAALSEGFDCPPSEIQLNDPFQGGHITRSHGNGALPWIQVEMNRRYYLAEPWYDAEQLTVDPKRLAELRQRFTHSLQLLNLGGHAAAAPRPTAPALGRGR